MLLDLTFALTLLCQKRSLQDRGVESTGKGAHAHAGRADGGAGGRRWCSGLVNLGNTCFANATLQGLAAVPGFLEFLHRVREFGAPKQVDGDGERGEADGESGVWETTDTGEVEFLVAVIDVLERLSVPHPERTTRSVRPAPIVAQFSDVFRASEQQDASEFLHLMMDVVDAKAWEPRFRDTVVQDVTPRHGRSSGIARWGTRYRRAVVRTGGLADLPVMVAATGTAGAGATADSRESMPSSLFKVLPQSMPEHLLTPAEHLARSTGADYHNPMMGLQASSIECPHRHSTPWKNERFIALSLPIRSVGGGALLRDIRQCIAQSLSATILHGYKCERCGSEGCTKRHWLSRPPRVLVIHLQRRVQTNYGSMLKLSHAVEFERDLDITDYVQLGSPRRAGVDNSRDAAASAASKRRLESASSIGTRGKDATTAATPKASSASGPTAVTATATDRATHGAGSTTPLPGGGTAARDGDLAESPSPSPPHLGAGGAGGPAESCGSAGRSSAATAALRLPVSEIAAEWRRSRHRYRLAAVVEHLGGPASGHYVTYRRAPGQDTPGEPAQWLRVSDEVVSHVPEESVLRAQAYMLFYNKLPQR